MEQDKGSSGVEKEAPVTARPPAGSKGDLKLVVIAIAVIAVLLVAVVAVSMTSDEDEAGDLDATVSPEEVVLDAGESTGLHVNATWDGESIDDSENASFSWYVDDASLGTIDDPGARTVTFTASSTVGVGLIGCTVEYNDSGTLYHLDVTADLTVHPESFASVTITPGEATLVFDRVLFLNATALDTLGTSLTNLTVSWTVEGLPAANYTLNTTTGYSVNFTANATGTAWVNASATYKGVTKSDSVAVKVIESAPTMDISRTRLPDGINWTCDVVTGELYWDEIDVILSNGTDTVTWSLTMGGLNGGTLNTTQFGVMTFGTMLVYLNVTDMTGNGSVDVGDFFTFTTSVEKFNPGKSYEVTLVYRPTGDTIVQTTFVG